MTRTSAKLAINKDKLRVVPEERLQEVHGGGDPPALGNPQPNSIGSWY